MAHLLSSLLKPKIFCDLVTSRGLHCIVKSQVHGLSGGNTVLQVPGAPSLFSKVINCFGITSVRNNIRIHFPKPDERKRVTRHGWHKRMATESGRKILMKRMLKGRHVLSH
ncbi:39S ribosomal protein L34, mitochondrial [Ischnura elegans]|uniref:39S ribosomal protein L34, mitochondrial n=1 Tax=Ischnura elegans TaxID=197161 RepID=UPI001ED885F6|nr:39S ribosomal protein L34, mitochondrial [Ischnura elegans]